MFKEVDFAFLDFIEEVNLKDTFGLGVSGSLLDQGKRMVKVMEVIVGKSDTWANVTLGEVKSPWKKFRFAMAYFFIEGLGAT